MTKQFWVGVIVGVVVSTIAGGLIGISMVGKKAVVPPSELEASLVNYLKTLKIPEAAPPATPIDATDENLLAGGEHYNHHCAACHDLEGDADSDLAKAFNPPVADITSDEVQRYSDEQLKWIVENGIRFTGMPGWKGIIDEPTQWKIVLYMRALADPEQAERLREDLEARGKWNIQPPDDHHRDESEGQEQAHREYEGESGHGADGHDHSAAIEGTGSQFDVYLEEIGPDTINVIKEVRAVTHLGLADAKAIVDAAPAALKKGVSRQEAEQIKARFAEIGASVDIR